jgi:hypothetical protein
VEVIEVWWFGFIERIHSVEFFGVALLYISSPDLRTMSTY